MNGNKRFIIGLMVFVVLACAGTAESQIGFQASFDRPLDTVQVVSSYDEPVYEFSAAMHPQTRVPLSRQLRFSPQVVGYSSDSSSLRFNTSFHGTKALVPVSVDARSFFEYRSRIKQKQKFMALSNQAILRQGQGQNRQGLNIGFQSLPKRFDKIFGEGGANLKITGYRRITFSGRSQWQDGAESDLIRQNKFPSLNMEQISRFDITGTIGSKITVSVSQDNQTDIPLANRLQIRYKGDDDDILKSIEAGNTNLSLPNTRFVGYSSRIQGLFGIKAEAQVGNLTLTGIASQEKGSTEKASIDAAGEANATILRDKDYQTSRIYDLGYDGEFGPYDKITSLYVYEFEKQSRVPEARDALLLIDPTLPDTDPVNSPYSENQTMVQLEDNLYSWYDDAARNLHYIYFNARRSDNKARAVSMIVERYTAPGVPDAANPVDTIGDITSDTLVLKTIHAGTSYDYQHPTWGLMWRNIYSIPKGVAIGDLDLKVFEGLEGREGTNSSFETQIRDGVSDGYYLEILGLDQYNKSQKKVPDNLLDDRIEVFRSDWGLLIFPSREPFNDTTTYELDNGRTRPLDKLIPTLYNYTSSTERLKNSQYYIQYVTRERSSIIRLDRVNIIEGSEVVTVNGRQLARGTDYNIQYDFGQITLLSDEATDPNADVSIDYEYAPFLAVQKKTLLGLRGEYEWSKNLKFGSTVLYKSDKAQDRKPRVGQETAKMLVLDFNVDFKIYPNFMTKAVNALPMVNTTQESQLAVSAEVAQSRPNPNVDNVAYIDDFEAALDRLNLGNSRTQWTKASAPVQIEGMNYQRGKMLWHRPYYSVAKEDVYDVTAAQGEGSISTLRLIYRPNPDEITTTITADTTFEIEVDTNVVDDGSVVDTTYDTTTTIIQIDTTSIEVDTAKVDSWAGIMRAFDGRVDSERAQLFEIRCRGGSVGGASSAANLHGKIHLDFGRITEDVNGDGISFNEDKPPWGNEDFSVDSLEDVGLDGLADQNEPGYDPVNNPDPDDDNWFFLGEGKCPVSLAECNSSTFLDRVENPDDPYYYEWLNGTEGNRRDLAVVGLPDNEELTGSFSEQNQYFSFVLDLDNYPDSFLVEGSERNGWVTYRIPIRDTLALDTVVGTDARWNQIQHIRIWYESDLTDSEEDTLEIADWYFVQSNWQDSLVLNEDLTLPGEPNFVVASVSTDDGTFTPPPNVEAYQDPQAGNVEEAQRGLALAYTDLRPGDTAIASRYLLTTEAYSGYRTLEMYVHGDEGLSAVGGDSIGFFFRLGNDSVNFYEYHTETRMYPGWDERNYVTIDFNEITALKDAALKNLATGQTIDTSDATYRIKGNPNINQVRYFATGVVNLDSSRTAASTGVVWVDELRLTEVRRDVGTAARVSFNGNGGDLFTYNFSYQATDPYFRGISTATRGGSSNNLGSGETVKNLVYGASLNIDRFLPRSWGARLPISFSYSKTTKIPLLRNNSDIVLPEDRRIEEKSISESKSFRVSESFGKKGRNPLFNILLNRQTVSFSYSRSTSSSVNRPFYLGENYNVTASYQAGITKPPTVPIFYIAKYIPILKKTAGSQLSLYPKVWRWQGTLNRNLSISEDADARRVSSLKKEFTGSMNMNYQVLTNLNTTFRYDTRRDLTDPDNVNLVFNAKDFKLGLETSYSQSFSGDYDPRLFGFFTMKWNYSVSYKDTYEQTTTTRKSDMSRTWNVAGQFKHLDLFSLGTGGGGGGSGSRARGRRTKKVDRPFYDPPLAALRFLTGWIDPLTYKYGQSYSNSLPGMTARPSFSYRFGLSDSAEVDIISTTRTQSAGEGETLELGSGFDVFGGISTDVRYKRGIDRDLIRTGKLNETRSTKWPDLTIRISQFKSFPLIKGVLNRFISVFSPRTGFNRDVREDFSLTDGFQTNKTVTLSYNPLLSVTFRVFRSLSLSGSYTKTNSEVTKFNLQTGDTDNETKTEKRTIAFSSKYQFSAPSGIALPLFGKLKFRSTVSIDLNVRYSNNKAENAKLGNPFVVTTDQSDMTVSPVISYTFSQQIKGGLSAKWQDSNDSKLNKKSHVRELQIWAEIRF